MNKIILLFAFLMLLSCSKSDDNSTATNNSTYSPPTWIQGTWGVVSYTGEFQKFYTFTTNNVCQISTGHL